jgi:hypothetical protein
MSFLDKVVFGFGPTLPLVLQTEATECGLACLAIPLCQTTCRVCF